MAKKKINSGYMTQTIDLESRILKYFPTDYKYFFNTPLFGTNDFANSNTYITNPDIEQQLDSFFCSSENLLSVFIGYNGMGKSTILKNYLKVHSSDELLISNNNIIYSKFNWDYNFLKENSYHFNKILHNINSRLCAQYHINWTDEKEAFFHFISVKDSSLISLDTPFEESLNEFSSYNSELFETRRLQFILQKQNIKQFSLVIDNIEALATDKYYILIGQFVECFRLLTENSFQAPVIKILFSFRPNTLYEAKQHGCFNNVEIKPYIKQINTINLEKYFNLKLKTYNKKNGNYKTWSKCVPLFMKVSQKYNRKYDQIIKKLCNYSVPESMKLYSNILSNSKWMHDTDTNYYEPAQKYFNIEDIIVNNITVIRAISCLEDDMYIGKRPYFSSYNSPLQNFRKYSVTSPSPICNLLYSTESEDYSILTLYIIKFLYKYCGQNNLYGYIYQKKWDIVRIFSEIFYGIENIEEKTSICISYLFNMQILDKSLKTKYGESSELTPQSRLYLTPRGEIMWEMLSWDSVLLEIFREDYYREYSEEKPNNPFCSYVLMHQKKQHAIFEDLINMIFNLLEKEKEYKERAIKNDTITSLKTNFGNECICSQLFEGLKQSMLYSGLIEDSRLNDKFFQLQEAINSFFH